MVKKIISAVLAVCMVFGSASLLPKSEFVQDTAITVSAAYGDFQYCTNEDDNTTVTITGYVGSSEDVNIPSSINGLTVTKIGSNCFSNNDVIKTVKIPKSVKAIGERAFALCDLLESVSVSGSGLETIWGEAFRGCKSLTDVKLPDSLQYIRYLAFEGCKSLSSIKLPKNLKSIWSNAFCETALKEIEIPENVDYIHGDVFDFTDSLEKITVSASNKEYSSVDGVLYNKDKTELLYCPHQKTSVKIPATVTSIGHQAFKRSLIESVSIPSSVTEIGSEAFIYCGKLKKVTVPGSVSTLHSGVFYGSDVSEFTLEEGITEINEKALGSDPTKKIYIPQSVKLISDLAFDDIYRGRPEYNTIIGYEGTEALEYAKRNSVSFVSIKRLAGKGRYETAAAISKSGFKSSTTVVLANGLNYADALAGVPLAYEMSAPILLTNGKSLDDDTLSEIKRLKANKIVILGGTGAVSENVEKELHKNGLKTERVAGKDRFETAVKIGERIQKQTAKKPADVFFVSSGSFADALSASSPASLKEAPIIFLRKDGTIDDASKKYLESIKGNLKHAYVIGGTGVISDDMKKSVGKVIGFEPQRLAGANRYETCICVNNAFSSVLKGSSICVAKGLDFPDALAGGLLAAIRWSPLVLADGDKLQDVQKTYLKDKNVSSIYVFGGTGAVSDSLVRSVGCAI